MFVADAHTKDARLRDYTAAQKSCIRLVHGHVEYGVHRHFEQPCLYITFLRDPVKRLISYYNHAWSEPDHYLHGVVCKQLMPMNEFFQSDLSSELDNLQVRMLAGIEKQVPLNQLTVDHLEAAWRHIEDHFPVVGTAECFDESILLMRRALDWKFFPLYVPAMVRKRPHVLLSDVPDQTRQIIRDRNQLDAELYRRVQERLKKQIVSAGSGFQRSVELYRRWNPRYAAIMQHMPMYRRTRREA